MNKLSLDERLSEWKSLRDSIKDSDSILATVQDFWGRIPTIPYNHKIDRYNIKSWPSPWEIIADNVYDDFTIALMMGYTLKLTTQFANQPIELRTMVDNYHSRLYNLIIIEDDVLNFGQDNIVKTQDIPDSFLLENSLSIPRPR